MITVIFRASSEPEFNATFKDKDTFACHDAEPQGGHLVWPKQTIDQAPDYLQSTSQSSMELEMCLNLLSLRAVML